MRNSSITQGEMGIPQSDERGAERVLRSSRESDSRRVARMDDECATSSDLKQVGRQLVSRYSVLSPRRRPASSSESDRRRAHRRRVYCEQLRRWF